MACSTVDESQNAALFTYSEENNGLESRKEQASALLGKHQFGFENTRSTLLDLG